MTALENEQRSQGGKTRAKNQDPEERKFQAMLAASSRPLKNDVRVTPEQLLQTFRELQDSHKWVLLGIVGADCRVILHIWKDSDVLQALKQDFNPIGFIGASVLGSRLQIYGKPLKAGNTVLKTLNRVSEEWRDRFLQQTQKAASTLLKQMLAEKKGS